jgi:hypothetical protein
MLMALKYPLLIRAGLFLSKGSKAKTQARPLPDLALGPVAAYMGKKNRPEKHFFVLGFCDKIVRLWSGQDWKFSMKFPYTGLPFGGTIEQEKKGAGKKGDMGLLRRFFNKGDKTEQITQIGRLVGERINELALSIYQKHRATLLAKPASHIVDAVWGTGRLSPEQKVIHNQVLPVIREIHEALDLTDLTPAQEYALAYLVRDLIISKVSCRVQAGKSMERDTWQSPENDPAQLSSMEPLGNA